MLGVVQPSTSLLSLEEAFRNLNGWLMPKSGSALPSLYHNMKSFWLPSCQTYFAMTVSQSTSPIRTSEYRFLFWDPQALVIGGIACPDCKLPLTNNGRIPTGPIKVYDMLQPFYIIGCEYACNSPACKVTVPEGRKYASTDPSILRALPTRLREEFPAKLVHAGDSQDLGTGPQIWNWKAMGVSTAIWNLVSTGVKAGVKKELIMHLIQSMQPGATGSSSEEFKQEDQLEAEITDVVMPDLSQPSTISTPPMSGQTNGTGTAHAHTPTTLQGSPMNHVSVHGRTLAYDADVPL